MTSEPRPESGTGTESGPHGRSGPATSAGSAGPAAEPRPGADAGASRTPRQTPRRTPRQAPRQASPQAAQRQAEQEYADRCYRSPAAMAGGVLLLVIGFWLCGDAVIGGTGRVPWIALAGLVFLVPLVIAFTLRPAVYAGDERLRVRNPFRTVTVPWGAVEAVRAGYSSEVVADGTKYQLWSIPVSMRARKRAARRSGRENRDGRDGPGGSGDGEKRAPSDEAVHELRALAERHGEAERAQGAVTVRWSYEILAPALAGGLALAVLLATR